MLPASAAQYAAYLQLLRYSNPDISLRLRRQMYFFNFDRLFPSLSSFLLLDIRLVLIQSLSRTQSCALRAVHTQAIFFGTDPISLLILLLFLLLFWQFS